jgi:competence protein ComGC
MTYRDVLDVRLNQKLTLTALLLAALLIISFGMIVFLATRPAQQVIIEKSGEGDHVVAINGQAVKSGFAIGPDKPGANDKKTIRVNGWRRVSQSIR